MKTTARFKGPLHNGMVYVSAILCAAALASCNPFRTEPLPDDVLFAMLGNTSPESPFGRMAPGVARTMEAINRSNPVFAVHLGNIVHGGGEFMGIREDDVSRQYADFFSVQDALKPLLYTTKGERDLYNGSSGLYEKFTRKSRWYSYNYGNLHFMVLDSTDPQQGNIGPVQREWIAGDLRNSGRNAVFVFSHHPLAVPEKLRTTLGGQCIVNADDITALFRRYRVQAVFSGIPDTSFIHESDGIRHVNAACGDYEGIDPFARKNQYVLVRFQDREIFISERRLPSQRLRQQSTYQQEEKWHNVK
jgi:hypothetical protein